jgi:tetratricopeptide (TPR) repeat protein
VRDIQGAGPDEVSSLFEAAARFDPHYAAVHVRLGDNLARHGRYDAARGALERAVEQAPDLAVAHRMLGQVALAQGDLAAAEAHLSRAIEIEPRDQSATTALAQVYMRTDRAAAAEELAARAADLPRVNVLEDPVYDRWVFERSLSASRALDRARIRIRDRDFAAAARDLELVLAAGGGGADVHALLGEAYAGLGRAEDAARQLERAAALDPARRP